MKKGGKIANSRIEFGLESLKELEKRKPLSKVKQRKKHKIKISNFLRKKSKKSEHKKIKIKKVKPIFRKAKISKHKTRIKVKKPLINIQLPDFPQKKEIKPEIREKVPSHLFGQKKKIVISKEFKKFEEKFRYEFVFFFGLIIATLGLIPDNKINIFFLFGISLIFISLFRYHIQKKKKKAEKAQTQKEIKEVTKKISKPKLQIKEINIKKLPLKNIKIISLITILIVLIFLFSRINFSNLPSSVRIFIITLSFIILVLFLLIIMFSRKKKTIIKKEGEIDINQARLIPIEVRKLKMPETYFDLVVEIVNKRGIITISELAKTFRITKERAEEWANILSDHNLITLYYPPIGEPVLKKLIKKEKEEGKKNAKTNTWILQS